MDSTLFTRLQHEYNKTPQDLAQIDSLLRSAMIQLSTAGIGAGDDSKSSSVDKQQIQQVLEMGAFWSIHSKNQTSFERYCSLLFPIYFDSKNSPSNVPNNAPMYTVLGLHLLNLLVSNRVADFYVALERINAAPGVDASNVFIQFPIQLQQCLVEGTFHRVVMARQQVPSPEYAWFIDGLMDTIR
jgi:26S proteasome regulatory subunit N12